MSTSLLPAVIVLSTGGLIVTYQRLTMSVYRVSDLVLHRLENKPFSLAEGMSPLAKLYLKFRRVLRG